MLNIDGYNVFRSDRDTRVGGGVLLYSHEQLPITNVQTFDDKMCQALICTCEISKNIMCVVYRPPDSTEQSFLSCLDFISNYIGTDNGGYELCLLGDFNLPHVEWSTNSLTPGAPTSSQNCATHLLNFMSDHLCSQFIMEPTRLNNILDLCVSNSDETITHITTSDTCLSDHRLIEIYWSHNPCNIAPSTTPSFDDFRNIDFNKADYSQITCFLDEVDWNLLWECCDYEDFPELFNLTLLQICEICCPKKVPPRPKSTNRSVRTLDRKRRKLENFLRRVSENPHSPASQIESLKRKLALLHMDIRDAIQSELLYKEQQAVDKVKDNPKYFYSYAKQFSKNKQNISMLFDENNNICTNPKDIANLLQKQFTSVFSDPSKTDIQSASFEPPTVTHPFTDDMLQFSVSDIIEAIDDIKPNAAAGPDNILVTLLKKCKESLAVPIHMIWNHSFDIGSVPSFYKLSHVFPLHKKDSRSTPANYRPISLTSHVIKIFERVIRKKLVSYLEANNFINCNQHGFRTGRSCLTQLLHHLDDVLDSLANNRDFDSIYLDYAKAFDKVDHKLLITKLHLYGIHPKIINWVESFLKDRTQTVVVDGHLSILAIIISGVPQGTVLGPILFLIFINDIALCIIEAILRCFADDTRISKSIASAFDVATLQRELYNVINWSNFNNMTLHKDKFEYICHRFSKHTPLSELPFTCELFQYHVSDTNCLSPVNQLRDLGVLISSDLSWSPHIRAISKKARQKAAWVFSVFHTRSQQIMLTLYKSMVRSLVEYCCPLWNPGTISDIQELESVQKAFTSRIAGMQEVHYWDRLKQLSLMSLQRRRERYIILHMWKLLNNTTSNDLQVQFVSRPRLGNLAKIPTVNRSSTAANSSLYDASFAVMGPKLWNAIPYHLNVITELNSFKRQVTKFLLSVPDTPPIRGYTTPNSNSLLCWRNDRDASVLWSGHM